MELPAIRVNGRSIEQWIIAFDERLLSLKEGQDWDRKLIMGVLAGVLVVIGFAIMAQVFN